eukprot:15485606-Alexandrium_andersonii.AAC.1
MGRPTSTTPRRLRLPLCLPRRQMLWSPVSSRRISRAPAPSASTACEQATPWLNGPAAMVTPSTTCASWICYSGHTSGWALYAPSASVPLTAFPPQPAARAGRLRGGASIAARDAPTGGGHVGSRARAA